MIQKRFLDIDKSDIDSLISDKVYEIKTLEYKSKLPGNTDSEKKEFLTDVSSFANASGGDIIFGISEKNETNDKGRKIPILSLIKGCSADKEKLRLEEIIRNGIAPRLKIQIKEISGWDADKESFIIVVRIPKSFISPHMVIFKGASRFFSRNSAGKYPLDVSEIRSAFLATESQIERINRFISDRLSRIVADETPVFLKSESRLVLHIIPIGSFYNNERIDLADENNKLTTNFPPISSGSWNHRYNFDGFVTYNQDTNSTSSYSYCQLFFCGAVEAVSARILQKEENSNRESIASIAYEKHVIEAINYYLNGYRHMGVMPPMIISMALLKCKNAFMFLGNRFHFYDRGNPIDRDNLILPNIEIEDFNTNVPKVMKPIFDIVWNACGYPYSYNYDEHGNWKLK